MIAVNSELTKAYEAHYFAENDEAEEAFLVLETLYSQGIPGDPTPTMAEAVDYFASLYSSEGYPEEQLTAEAYHCLGGKRFWGNGWVIIYVPGVSFSLFREADGF